jgi:ubiquinone/menaquinone biosynthesis C-methylase UbiE
MLILDIGCGTGGIEQLPIEHESVIHADFDLGFHHQEIRCDAQHLPFRDGVFTHVHSAHTLEHIPQPLTALQEFKRVARNLIIKVPTLNKARYYSNESREHIYTWSISAFTHLLELVYDDVQVSETWIHRVHVPVFQQTLRHVLNLLFGQTHTQLFAVCK